MTQNLISLDLPAKTLEALDQAIAILEEVVTPFITLTADEVRGLVKMGGKSEQFCRQTLVVLDQNQDSLPPSLKLEEVRRDLAAFDAIRPRLLRLLEVLAKMQDTQTALGSDVLMASLEGYALMKMFGKGEGLEALRQAMAVRRPTKAAKVVAAV